MQPPSPPLAPLSFTFLPNQEAFHSPKKKSHTAHDIRPILSSPLSPPPLLRQRVQYPERRSESSERTRGVSKSWFLPEQQVFSSQEAPPTPPRKPVSEAVFTPPKLNSPPAIRRQKRRSQSPVLSPPKKIRLSPSSDKKLNGPPPTPNNKGRGQRIADTTRAHFKREEQGFFLSPNMSRIPLEALSLNPVVPPAIVDTPAFWQPARNVMGPPPTPKARKATYIPAFIPEESVFVEPSSEEFIKKGSRRQGRTLFHGEGDDQEDSSDMIFKPVPIPPLDLGAACTQAGPRNQSVASPREVGSGQPAWLPSPDLFEKRRTTFHPDRTPPTPVKKSTKPLKGITLIAKNALENKYIGLQSAAMSGVFTVGKRLPSDGNHMEVFLVSQHPNLVVKFYKPDIIEGRSNRIPMLLKNTLDQYRLLTNTCLEDGRPFPLARIVNADTAEKEGFLLVEYIPHAFPKFNDLEKDTFLDKTACHYLTQVKDIFNLLFDQQIMADAKHDNFRIKEDGTVVLIDYMEYKEERFGLKEIDGGENPFATILGICLRSFANGSEAIYNYLDPRIKSKKED